MAGTRAYRVQFFDAPTDGNSLGAPIEGFVTVSSAGRYSIEITPPSEVFTAADVYYSLGVDSNSPTDGSVDPGDVFPTRASVTSVPFALRTDHASAADTAQSAVSAEHAVTADHALTSDTAATAMALSGQLTNPGDQIPLGGGVFLQVAEDGKVEFLSGGQRFRLAAQKWFDPKNLLDNFSPDGQDALVPQIAVNDSGEAVIAWVQSDGSVLQVFRSQYRNGSWKDPSDLSENISPDGQQVSDVRTAINNRGEALIVWSQSDGAHSQLFRSEYRNGSWTDPTSPSDNFTPDGFNVLDFQVAMSDNGDAVIVWRQIKGTQYQIYRSEYRNGAWIDPLDTSANINPEVVDANDPQVAMDKEGNAVIVWYQFENEIDAIRQVYRSEYRNGAWIDPSGPLDNISPDGQNAFDAKVSMGDNGEAVIVWTQFDGVTEQIFRSEYRNGVWNDPSSLSDNISPSGQNAGSPHVSVNAGGDAIIVWHQSNGGNNQIFRSEYRNDVWTDPSDLSEFISPAGQDAFFPKTALNKAGEAVIVWRQSDGTNPQVFRSEYRNGAWIDPSGLADNISPNGINVLRPETAMGDNGDTVIVWYQFDGASFQAFRSEYRFGF